MQELITQEQLGEFLGMHERTARELCHRHGVEPVNITLGTKGKRLRWRVSSVMEMLDIMQAVKQPAVRKARTGGTVDDIPVTALIAMLAAPEQ